MDIPELRILIEIKKCAFESRAKDEHTYHSAQPFPCGLLSTSQFPVLKQAARADLLYLNVPASQRYIQPPHRVVAWK